MSATAKASDFKLGMQLEFAKSHHKTMMDDWLVGTFDSTTVRPRGTENDDLLLSAESHVVVECWPAIIDITVPRCNVCQTTVIAAVKH